MSSLYQASSLGASANGPVGFGPSPAPAAPAFAQEGPLAAAMVDLASGHGAQVALTGVDHNLLRPWAEVA